MSLGTSSRLRAAFALALAAVLFGAVVQAQVRAQVRDDRLAARLAAAMEAGDAAALLEDAAARVELVLFDRSGLYSRGQAVLVLQGFFRRHPPGHAELDEWVRAPDSRTAMGRYSPATGDPPLRVSVRLRPGEPAAGGERWQVDAVRIERGSTQNIGGLR